MFYAMNRFDVPLDQCEAFEARWLSRDSKLHEFEGFVEFNLLKAGEDEGSRLYISHTVWRSEADFQVWLKSSRFKQSHGRPTETDAPPPPRLNLRAQFEALTSVQRLLPEGQA